MADKLMQISKDNTKKSPSVDLKRLHTQLNEPTNQNLVKGPKVVKPTNKKTLL